MPFPVSPQRQLWLCIYLPALPLEAMVSMDEAAAVFEERQGIRKILLANVKARATGIGPGLTVNAALALLPTLKLEERNPAREARVLRSLANWSEKFTAFTSIDAPSLLLLEIAGSQRLFGGIKPLRERIIRGLQSQGFYVEVAIAPTPLAATWLARAGKKVCVRDARNLVGRLAPLPIHCLRWPEAICHALKGMGITTVGEALRLPRQGFAKRFSAARLLELDRALGRLPDPRVSYRSPERFVADFDLNEEESDSALLLNVCQELLVKLERFLLSRQMAVQQVEFVFFHLQAPATHLALGCVRADRAVQHWFDLAEIKLDRLMFSAPVIAIQLRGGEGQRFAAETDPLPFCKQERPQRNTSIVHLAERLSARIGDEAVHGVMTVAEHRPQYAWQRRNAFDDVPHCANVPGYQDHPDVSGLLEGIRRTNSIVLQRPLWMLQDPEKLVTEQGIPCYQGRLKLLDGPERLETGWWDGDGIARDYFVACNARGAHLWIYRNRGKDRDCRSWYLHGMFG
ncbi:MAG: DNA polymerase Y family protein [Proteobacteria bacterium]|nr:DNA polymerase Y family protein [Pseudomonadota bacterium]MDA0993890.1 DNA polymerase Y family protein [Pseudomonadota bacterium]